MSNRYTEAELRECFYEALSEFQDRLDTDFNKDNIELVFFVPENGIEVYETLCKKFFPKHLSEKYKAEGYFETFAAQAFVENNHYGVMVRSDIDFTLGELLQMFLHEFSHLFCTKNEIDGGNFFDKYCLGSGDDSNFMYCGYAVWREAIADIMADSMLNEFPTQKFALYAPSIQQLYDSVSIQNPESKKNVSLIIALTFDAADVSSTNNWGKAERAIRKSLKVKNEILYEILALVFAQLQHSPFWEITPEFIHQLGFLYVELISFKDISLLKNMVLEQQEDNR